MTFLPVFISKAHFSLGLFLLFHGSRAQDTELSEARQTIEILKKQSGESVTKDGTPVHNNCSPSLTRRHTINTTIDSNTSKLKFVYISKAEE